MTIRAFINLVEKFDNFGKTDILYHGCGLDNFWLVYRDGILDSSVEGRGHAGPKGVSLTRSYKVALEHANIQTDNMSDSFFDWFDLPQPTEEAHRDYAPLHGVVLVFERGKIAGEIIPFDDFGDGENDDSQEAEERVVGTLPLDPALKTIYINHDDLAYFVKAARTAHANKVNEYDEKFFAIIDRILADPRVEAMP